MYHSISETDETGAHPYYRLCTSPAQFEGQLQLLRRNHYVVLPLVEALEKLVAGTLTAKSVVLTFDDGYEDFYSNAFPRLQNYGFPSTVFLPVEYIAYMGLRLNGKEHLSWDQVNILSKNGVSFGSHSCTHRQLAHLTPWEVMHELARSKEIIEGHLGTAVTMFSYPFSFPDANKPFVKFMRDSLLQCGYTHSVTTRIGTASAKQDVFSLPRLPVNSADDEAFFKAKLEGDYNWIYPLQYSAKWIKEKLWL